MGAKFGPAGNSESFQAMGYRKTIQVPEYITRMGLDAYEYQCGRGVRISEEAARAFGEKAREHQVTLSLHSPYYISLSGIEEEKRLGSIEDILQSARAADAMGAQRVVVHSGSCAKLSRQQAMELAKDTLTRAYQRLDQEGLGHIRLCPETMGKLNQLGTLEEGACADLAVLRVRQGRFGYMDCGGARLTGEGRLECVATLRAGEVVFDPEARSMPEWREAPEEYWKAPGLLRSWTLWK